MEEHKITFRLEKEAHEVLIELSKKYRCTMSWLLRRAILLLRDEIQNRRITL